MDLLLLAPSNDIYPTKKALFFFCYFMDRNTHLLPKRVELWLSSIFDVEWRSLYKGLNLNCSLEKKSLVSKISLALVAKNV